MPTIPADAVGSLENAARVAGVSSDTVKKWIARGEFGPGEVMKLKAVRGRGHAYAINLAAAARLGKDHWTPRGWSPLPDEMPLLESEESLVVVRPVLTPVRVTRVARSPKETRKLPQLRPTNIEPLPAGWVTVNSYTQRHGMKKNYRGMWQEKWRAGKLHVQEGAWWHGNYVVNYAFDPEGQRDLGRVYGNHQWWVSCAEPGCLACLFLNQATIS